jgi:multicomponent Na+:H+ antiporter subunit B
LKENYPEERSVIVETVSRVMIPFIQLFALYVIIHGASGPGGGFQGGVIFAASIILYALTYSLSRGKRRFPPGSQITLATLGLSIYAGIGLLCLLFGRERAHYLNYGFLPFTGQFESNRALAMEVVEIGIGLAVMAMIVSIFFDLAGPGNHTKEEEEKKP